MPLDAASQGEVWVVHHRLADVVAGNPDGIALTAGDRHVSYREFDTRANQVAWLLGERGVGRAAVVAVLVDKTSPEFVIAALGCWKAGAVYLPIDPRVPAPQVERMFAGVEPAAVVGPAALVEPYAALCPVVLRLDTEAAALDRMPPEDPDVAVDPGDLAYIVHTSGSTGVPKPVAVSHRAFTAVYLGWEDRYELGTRAPVSLQAASPAFDVHIGDIARGMFSGGRMVLCPNHLLIDPPALGALIERESIDTLELTPTVLRLLSAWLIRTGRTLPSLRLVVSGGEQLTSDGFRQLRRALGPAARIVNSYGVSEAGIDSTYQDVTDEVIEDGDVVPIGHVFPRVAIAVLDEGLRPVERGEVGELFIAGDGLAEGYYRRPDITDERYLPALPDMSGTRMYRTGDLVLQRPHDGAVVYVGRADDEVKIRGTRIRLGAVEAAVLSVPGVVNAAVVRADRAGEDALIAHVVIADGVVAPDGVELWLRGHVAALVPDAMVPAEVVVHERLPLSRSGKVDRKALSLVARGGERAGFVASTPAERVVAEQWYQALGRPPVDRDDNLFEAGGTSLTAARLVSAVNGETGLDLSVSVMFASPKFADLVALVDAADGRAEPIGVQAAEVTSAPIGPGQHGLWLLHQLRPEDPTYHLPTQVTLTGPLVKSALCRALDLMIERHDALRTSFRATPDGPVLLVEPPMPFPLDIVDGTAAEVFDEIVRRPFTLDCAPLIRGVLVRRGPELHDLILVTHHIVFDDWSERVLLRDIGEVYTAFATGVEPALTPLAIRYLDFAAWRSRRLASEIGATQRGYWRDRLARLPAPLELPSTAAGTPSGVAAVVSTALPAELSDAVRATAGAHGVTPYVALLSVFSVLLGRWSGQQDLVVGAPFGYRDRPESQDLVGFLVSTLPLRLAVPPDSSFGDVLSTARDALAEATAHAEVPFDEMVREAGLAGAGDRNRIFRVWFNWLGVPTEPPVLHGLVSEVAHLTVPGALFDLAVYVTDGPDGFRLDLVHDTGVLDGGHMTELLAQYVELAGRLCSGLPRPVSEPDGVEPLDMAPRDDIPALVPALGAAAVEHAGRVALRTPSGDTTYAELYGAAAVVAAALHEAGAGPGDVVPVFADRVSALVPALLGVLGTGAAFTLLDAEHPPSRLAAQLGQVGAKVGLRLRADVPTELTSACGTWLDVPADLGACWPVAERPADAPAYVAFTSGTTGHPNAVTAGALPLANFLGWYTERFGIGPADRFALLSGLGHDPLLRDVLAPLWTGASVAVPPLGLTRAAADLLEWLGDQAVTVLHATPALCRMLAASGRLRALPDLRLVVCGGDILHRDDLPLIRSWAPDAVVVNAYGTTETPQIVSYHVVGDEVGEWVPIGSGAPGAALDVVDGHGGVTAVGELGVVVVRGPYLANGTDGRHVTGDLGRRGPGGEVTLYRRDDDQVQVRGFRVELEEVDRHLRGHPDVFDAATRVVQGPDGENQLVGYVVPRGGLLPVDAVRAYLRAHLPEHMVPSRFAVVASIPLTANRKVDRAALPSAVEQQVPSAEPSTALEQVVGDVWREVLVLPRIGVDQNFFDLGASSVLLTRAHVALEAALSQQIPITALFEHMTVRALAGHLAGGGASVAVLPRADRPLGDIRARRLAARSAARSEETST